LLGCQLSYTVSRTSPHLWEIPVAQILKQARTSPLLRSVTYFAIPVVVLAAIWSSVIKHYYVTNPAVTIEMIELGRQEPPNDLLDELSSFRFFDDENHLYTVDVAEKILQGEFALPGEEPRHLHLPFDPHDIDQGSPYWQLSQARLIIPRILLAAYRTTMREEFFLMARDVILAWASYERRAFLPKGELWEDQAIAERVLALSDFWAVYRHHPTYNLDVAEVIFLFAARSGHFLADPAFFYRLSNHGVMQNLGLWHLSLAFPSVPETQQYRKLAFERFDKLMGFYVNDEGIVIEHSAGYHKTGVQFLSMAFRYMTLHQMNVPQKWRQKYEKARGVYAQLRRPDGSLPMFGDTEGGVGLPGPLVSTFEQEGVYGPLLNREESSQPQPNSVYPVAGYSIWWDKFNASPGMQDLSQTVVAWSYFPAFAHKHADEMSVLLWAKGQAWWTNVGYWPYGTDGRREAESWNGSNAPHLVDESASSIRKTRLLGQARVDGLAFIDLERRGPGQYIARRQVAQASPGLWVVLDHTSGTVSDRTTTVWTAAHDVQLREGRTLGSYDLTHTLNGLTLRTFIFGSTNMSIQTYKGSHKPFAGWQMAGDKPFDAIPTPASAIMVEQPASDSWVVMTWSLDDTGSRGKKLTAMPSMHAWNGPENWAITLHLDSGAMRLFREADKVFLDEGRTRPLRSLTLARPVGIDQEITGIQDARQRAKGEFPRPTFQDAVDYRFKATYLVIALLTLQEVLFAGYKRFAFKGYTFLRAISPIVWVVVGIWLLTRVPLI
jgi:hypothetical protein